MTKIPAPIYALIMLGGTALLAVPPFIFLLFKKPSWPQQHSDKDEEQ